MHIIHNFKVYKRKFRFFRKLVATGQVKEYEYGGQCIYTWTMRDGQGWIENDFNVQNCTTLKQPQLLTRLYRELHQEYGPDLIIEFQ